jgi:hypothetical protein
MKRALTTALVGLAMMTGFLVWRLPATGDRGVASCAEAAAGESLSMATALFTLAAYCHARAEQEGASWVLTTHDYLLNTNVVKLQEGDNMVVSIPVLEEDGRGFEQFAAHFNAFTVRRADRLVLQGNPEAALRIYQLVRKFQPRHGLQEGLHRRIRTVEVLQRQGEVDWAEKEIFREYDKLTPIPDWSAVYRTPATPVTNLLEAVILGR